MHPEPSSLYTTANTGGLNFAHVTELDLGMAESFEMGSTHTILTTGNQYNNYY